MPSSAALVPTKIMSSDSARAATDNIKLNATPDSSRAPPKSGKRDSVVRSLTKRGSVRVSRKTSVLNANAEAARAREREERERQRAAWAELTAKEIEDKGDELRQAAGRNDVASVRKMIAEGYPYDSCNYEGFTALMKGDRRSV